MTVGEETVNPSEGRRALLPKKKVAASRCVDWGVQNLIAVVSPEQSGRLARRRRRGQGEIAERPQTISLMRNLGNGRRKIVCQIHAHPHLGSKVSTVKWDPSGQLLASIDESGRVVVWRMQDCINRWAVSHTWDCGEPVVALTWLKQHRHWVVSTSDSKKAIPAENHPVADGSVTEGGPTAKSEKAPFQRTRFRGPRAPTTGCGLALLTIGGKLIVHHRDLSETPYHLETELGRLANPEVPESDAMDVAAPRMNLHDADFALLEDDILAIVVHRPSSPTQPVEIYHLKVEFWSKEISVTSRSSASVPIGSQESSSTDGTQSILDTVPSVTHLRWVDSSRIMVATREEPFDRTASTQTGRSKLCILKRQEGKPEGERRDEWVIGANQLCRAESAVTALEVCTPPENGGNGRNAIVLVGYGDGHVEIRDPATLATVDLWQHMRKPYETDSNSSGSGAVRTETAPDASEAASESKEGGGTKNTVTSADGGADHNGNTQTANSAAMETDTPQASITEPGTSILTSRKRDAIVSFAVSPNAVELLAASRDGGGQILLDGVGLERSLGKGNSPVAQNVPQKDLLTLEMVLATKLSLAMMSGREYTDVISLLGLDTRLANKVILRVISQQDTAASQRSITGAGAKSPLATGDASLVAARLLHVTKYWWEHSLLGLQLAVHRGVPGSAGRQLYFNTESAIQILEVLQQCYASFEFPHLSRGHIEKAVESGIMTPDITKVLMRKGIQSVLHYAPLPNAILGNVCMSAHKHSFSTRRLSSSSGSDSILVREILQFAITTFVLHLQHGAEHGRRCREL
ncbi:uncharacterized protein EV422DRAFT_5564 [Fimicolochytrium jonesii]|uniref:uncharacterized protein n=1 Tax=Fimicolochytrium jonesii TaxID=1396493 RepID=UPI0022FE774A|nr:uncharacterized protein EV422DRAFT_5564 [Fimicolochytrium jonesii]KAI8826662.1 hypothetical protein EV422DRAFT_5564 [Fimicolochytrium jonesii]